MSESAKVVKLLAVTSETNREVLKQKLCPMDQGLVCVNSIHEIASFHRKQQSFEVVLLPASLSDADWWTVWSELSTVSPKPSILIYTRQPTFQFWTAVLDLGGYDVISEPFGDEEIKSAVLSAAEDYRSRCNPEPTC